jgi:hypothetical protein
VVDGSVCYPDSLPPSLWHFLPGALRDRLVGTIQGAVNVVVGTGQALVDSVKLGIDWATGVVEAPVPAEPILALEEEVPSWVVLYTNTSGPANTLSFNWRFASTGEGFVRVFVDDVPVAEIDRNR